MQCSQCGKPAVAQTVDGIPLCVDCVYKLEQIRSTHFAQAAALLNHLSGLVELHTGLGVPPMQIPPPMGNTRLTFNNVKIDGSVVGSINTGEIGKLDVMMSHIRAGGDSDLADALQRFTQAVIDSDQLTDEEKNTVLEHLSFLATQRELPKEQRQSSVGRTVISGIAQTISTAGGLAEVWQVLQPMIADLF